MLNLRDRGCGTHDIDERHVGCAECDATPTPSQRLKTMAERHRVVVGEYAFVSYEGDSAIYVWRYDEIAYAIEKYNAVLALMLELETAREAMSDAYRWIAREHGSKPVRDHACAECVPGGDMVIAGFACTPHRAIAYLAHVPPRETFEEAVRSSGLSSEQEERLLAMQTDESKAATEKVLAARASAARAEYGEGRWRYPSFSNPRVGDIIHNNGEREVIMELGRDKAGSLTYRAVPAPEPSAPEVPREPEPSPLRQLATLLGEVGATVRFNDPNDLARARAEGAAGSSGTLRELLIRAWLEGRAGFGNDTREQNRRFAAICADSLIAFAGKS